MKDYIAEAEERRERAEQAGYEAKLRERAVIAAERQAAALERIAAVLEGGNDRKTDAFRKVVAALEFGDVATAAKVIKEYQG